ncbi:DUF2513 domain-containing protein [Hwanghaeella sp.]|uniref:DUF2513 domain-containing protein n=1 Tax=Hwanghaeella sp. TaxID=2605943 RepID=UPI003CCB85B5
MKRDLDLIRKLLLEVEASDGDLATSDIEMDPWSPEEISYNTRLLIENEFLTGLDDTDMGMGQLRNFINLRLTWAGHDYLDAVRSDATWKKVTEKLQSVGGSVALDIVKDLGTAFIRQQLDL